MRAGTAALLGLLLLGAMACGRQATGDEIESLKTAAAPIIQRIEQHRERTGAYPADLVSAGVTPPGNRFGGWEYHLLGDGTWALSTGDYFGDGFTLCWSSLGRRWVLDSF